jgi:hypothetical protein
MVVAYVVHQMLQRNAFADTGNTAPGPPPEQVCLGLWMMFRGGGYTCWCGPQDIPLNVPKKTKLFVEQTQREREQVRYA